MTERALPAVGVGARTRPRVVGQDTPIVRTRDGVAARPAVARKEAVLSTPVRAGLLFGATAAVYAVTLAGVSAFQAETDAAAASAAVPYLESLAEARAANDALESRIGSTNAGIATLVDVYGAVGINVSTFQARLDELAALVSDVRGSAAALPNRIKLPNVTVVRSSGGGGTKSAPATTAKSGASGG